MDTLSLNKLSAKLSNPALLIKLILAFFPNKIFSYLFESKSSSEAKKDNVISKVNTSSYYIK